MPRVTTYQSVSTVFQAFFVAQKTQHYIIQIFKKLNADYFKNDLMNIDFSLIERQNNVETSLKMFYEQILSVLSKHAPLKQKRVRRQIQPGWFNDEIKRLYMKEIAFTRIEISKTINGLRIKQHH